MSEADNLKALDALIDQVLAYRPKPKSKAARVRKRKAAKIKRESGSGER